MPSGLTATPESADTVNLSWSADSGSDGTVTYLLYRNGTKITSTTNLTYGDSGLTGGDTYEYTRGASDNNGTSNQSSQVGATTLVAACQIVTIPAYYGPDDSGSPWAAATTDDSGGIMIANPDSGPYTLAYWDGSGYPAAITAAGAAGIQVYGYVDTDYMIDPSNNGANGTSGNRSNTISDVETQINTWLSYGVKNIFFDEVTDGVYSGLGTDPNNSTEGQPNTYVEDYQELTAYVHANGGR